MMTLLHKFLNLQPAQRWLLAHVAIALVMARASLYVLPWKWVLAYISLKEENPEPPADFTANVVWGVSVISHGLPGMTCLAQALAAGWIFKKNKYQYELCIGVHREKNFEAHAWIKVEGKVVLGMLEELDRFALLYPIKDSIEPDIP